MKTILITLSLVAVLIFPLIASTPEHPLQTVRGTVVDKVSKESLPGAGIVLLNTSPLLGTTTGPDGSFRLNKVPVGRISLKITFLGYKDIYLNNLNLQTGKELVLDIEMEESVLMQQGVEIKATRDKSLTNNEMTSVSARGFTIEETGRYAGSRNDVARMASNFAGMTGSSDARNDIVIRGNSPLGLLWRLEGVEIPNPNHYGSPVSSGGPVCIINNNLLSNSDFLTGAFPAEYGNAVSGVFDLKLRNGNNEQHEFLGQVGFNGFELGAEGPIQKEKRSSYLLNYRYSTLSVMQAMGVDLGTGTGIPFYQDASFKLNFPATGLGSFSLFGIGGVSDIEMWDSKSDTADKKLDFYGGEGYDLTNGARMFTGGLSHVLTFTGNAYLKSIFSLYYHQFVTEVDSLEPLSLAKTRIYDNNLLQQGFVFSSTFHKKFSSRDNLKIGFISKDMSFDLVENQLLRSEQESRPISDFRGRTQLLQSFFQLQHNFSDELTLNAGLHHQHFLFNASSAIEPRAGLKWQYRPGRSLSLGYGLHSQTSPISVYFRQMRMTDGSFQRLNEDISLIKSHHLVVGHDLSLPGNTRLKTEIYYQYLYHAAVNAGKDNYFSMLNEGANFGMMLPDSLKAEGLGKNIGLEVTLERFLSKGLYYLFTLSLYDSKYQGSDKVWRNTAFNGNYVLNALAGKEVNLGGKAEGKRKALHTLNIDLKATWSGGQRYVPFSTEKDPYTNYTTYRQVFDEQHAYSKRYPDYLRFDLKLMYRRNGKKVTQEWGVDIQNITDMSNVYSERFNKKTGEKDFIYQMGRLVVPQYRIIF